MHPRVEIFDGRHTLVPEGGDEGADRNVHYVLLSKTWTNVQKGQRPTLPTKASPGLSLTYVFLFKLLILLMVIYVHLCSGIELKP
jgi:hypothetical protein